MKTICACGRKATCNGRKVNGEFVFEGAQVAIDTVDAVEYQSLCPPVLVPGIPRFPETPPRAPVIHSFISICVPPFLISK